MKKKTDYNPYGLHERMPLLKKLAFLATVVAALAGTVLFFPLLQMLKANGAPTVVYYLVYYLSEFVSTAALFTLFALLVLAVCHEERSFSKSIMLKEILSLLGIAVLCRLFLYWFTAFLDTKLAIGFYFNNVTLSYILENAGYDLISYTLSALVNALLVVGMLYLVIFLTKKGYQKAKKRGVTTPFVKKLPVFVYLAVSLLLAVLETVLSIVDYGVSADFSVLFSLLMPYVEIAAFGVLGYYYLTYLIDWLEKETA